MTIAWIYKKKFEKNYPSNFLFNERYHIQKKKRKHEYTTLNQTMQYSQKTEYKTKQQNTRIWAEYVPSLFLCILFFSLSRSEEDCKFDMTSSSRRGGVDAKIVQIYVCGPNNTFQVNSSLLWKIRRHHWKIRTIFFKLPGLQSRNFLVWDVIVETCLFE